MSENKTNEITLKSVGELLKSDIIYRIPYYQRGYRWKEVQVKQLLDDISSFTKTEKNPFYFLQALVLTEDAKGKTIVVDGQQRLTTLSLLLNVLKSASDTNKVGFLYDRGNGNEESNESGAIDEYYKNQANDVIKNFIKTWNDEQKKTFQSKIENDCKFLVYHIQNSGDNGRKTFDELNSGKISVRDSELVKCVLLSPGTDESAEITSARASEWDTIERAMNNDAFFAWMTPRNTWREDDRMTVLLRHAGICPDDNNRQQEVFPFLKMFQGKLAGKDDAETQIVSRVRIWKDICSAYYRLIAWFNDPLMYHAFGWFVHRKHDGKITSLNDNSLKELHNQFIENINKASEFKSNETDDYNVTNQNPLYHCLLLCNVAYCWKRWPMRYDFLRHRSVESWSLEHIFARNQRNLIEKEFKEWYPHMTCEEDVETAWKDYQEQCKSENGNEWLSEKLKGKYPQNAEDNTLKNLAMLPKDPNSSFNNKLFDGKRKSVVSWADKGWKSYWVPPVTEAVFLKSIPNLDSTLYCWSDKDKNAYVSDIKKLCTEFVGAVKKYFQ